MKNKSRHDDGINMNKYTKMMAGLPLRAQIFFKSVVQIYPEVFQIGKLAYIRTPEKSSC
jgi:hypothetical protein